MDLTCSFENRSIGRQATPAAVRWLLPDLAGILSILTVFLCLFFFDGTQKLFRDSDTGWHIRTGDAILAGGGLPRTDPYSLLRNGQPWLAWEWGSDLLMGAVHRADGMSGVALLYAVAIGLCTWIWLQIHWAASGNFLIAGAMTTLLLSTANLHWLARPHVFGWLFVLCALWYAESLSERPRLLLAALFSAAWANMHASFFLGPAIALVYCVSHLMRPLIWRLNDEMEWRKARTFAALAAASLIGSFANPYGWNLHWHVISYLRDTELISHIGEFQGFNFHAEGSTQILLCLGIAALGGVLALGQRNLAHFFLAIIFLALALRSARALPLAALLLLPLANGAITLALSEVEGLQYSLQGALTSFLRYSNNLRTIDAGMRGYAMVPIAMLIAFAALHAAGIQARTGFPPDEFPVEAASQIDKLPTSARILAPDKFGGYLIYRFNGSRRVFFDGRSDFYGGTYMNDYIQLIEVRPGWQQLLDRAQFTHALLPNRYSLIPALRQIGWKQIYADGTATLLEKR